MVNTFIDSFAGIIMQIQFILLRFYSMRFNSIEDRILYGAGVLVFGVVFIFCYIFLIRDDISLAICFGLSGGLGFGFPQIYKSIKEKIK